MTTLINTFGFDGIDIDFEGSSVTVSGGTIANPTDAKILNLIDAVKQIMQSYHTSHNKKLLQTILEKKNTLIDYECLKDENGVYFCILNKKLCIQRN